MWKKSKLKLFNSSRNYDFMPEITMSDNQLLEVTDKMKLLGITVSSNMKWHDHVADLCKRGHMKLWMIRRLRKMGANKETLNDLYEKQIRTILEYATPVWHPGLTSRDSYEIERVQKSAYAIIYGNQPYKYLLKKHNKKSLQDRRQELCRKFAMKSAKNNYTKKWFNPKLKTVNTRSKDPYYEVPCKTNRWKNSPIPFMTALLNKEQKKS